MNIVNICDLNLEDLSQKIKKNSLTESELSIINRIMWFDNNIPCKIDIVMVLGFPECVEKRLPKAIKLYAEYNNPYLLLSGGVLINGSVMTEAEAMKKACLEAGISSDKILLENESTNTMENVIFSSSVVREIHRKNATIVAVSSSTHLRRVCMNFTRYKDLYPDVIRCTAIPSDDINRNEWFNDIEIRNQVARELLFIKEYIYELGYEAFDI